MFNDAEYWISHLNLIPHIEGGYFSEIYKSALLLDKFQLPTNFTSARHSCTHIYFLLKQGQFSALHRIKSDELWHFYSGDSLTVYEIDNDGLLTEHVLGNQNANEKLFTYIKAGSWFGAALSGGSYALVGCTVSPGFDYTDFEMADKEVMIEQFPMHESLIKLLAK